MKRIISIILIVIFSVSCVMPLIGCSAAKNKGKEVRACWVCSVGNMDFPSEMGLSANQLKKEIETIVQNCVNNGMNTIFFQVRPNGDALYKSEVFPWSVYLSGKQGVAPEKNFDPLEYFIEQAHKSGIALHAWLNPYRIGSGKNVWDGLSSDNPAVLHKEYAIESETGLYYDPGLPEVRALILDGIGELVRNYDVDGIHFDDYFYPYDLTGFDDSATFKTYGNGRSLADFRRESVDELVRSAYTLIKTIDPLVEFGISPFGIWANQSTHPDGSKTSGMSSYAEIFSDSKKWVEKGWLDYICPQVYWSFEFKRAPFDVVVDWWDALCKKSDVKLYIGIAVYKINTDEAGWEKEDQVKRQLEYAAKKKSYDGHCFFRYGILMENPNGVLDSVRNYYSKNVQKPMEIKPSDMNVLPQTKGLSVSSPAHETVVSGEGVSVCGTASSGQSVLINGIEATVSPGGLFSAFVPLRIGENHLTVRSGNESKSILVFRKAPEKDPEFLDLSSAYPQGVVEHCVGDLLHFSIDAPQGSALLLTNGLIEFHFIQQQDSSQYICDWTVPSITQEDKLELDGFYYEIIYPTGEKERISSNLKLILHREKQIETSILSEDAYIFDQSAGGSQMDHLPLSKGMPVSVVAKEGSRALLKNGFWVDFTKLGEESVARGRSDYYYQTVEILGENPALITPSITDDTLRLNVLTEGDDFPQVKANSMKLAMEREACGNGIDLRIYSKAGYRLMGYEICHKKGGATVYLRFQEESLRGKTIMLDAGHGGPEVGALGPGGENYPMESEMNLNLANVLKQELEDAGATVLLSRGGDSSMSLEERVALSELKAPDLFISLHHNSIDQTQDYNLVSGGSVHYSSPLAKDLAEHLSANLWAGISSNGSVPVHKQSLYVCRQTQCPAVLIEAGYLCNPNEYEKLCKPDNVLRIAKNIVRGLKTYYDKECL